MLVACVSSQTPRPETRVAAAHDVLTDAHETLAAGSVQVDITAPMQADTVECHKTAPTGTRIAIQRCESSAASSDVEQATRDQMLRDIDTIRRQQWQLEAARQNAMQSVLTQGAAAPAPSPQP